MRKAKKQMKKENEWFDTKGVIGFSKSESQILPILHDFYESYENLKNIPEFNSNTTTAELKAAEQEYREFIAEIREYSINLRAASKVGEIFLDAAKNTLEKNTKMDHGYNKNGVFISDKKILANIPSMTVNNKV
jgi:hypothetical protein